MRRASLRTSGPPLVETVPAMKFIQAVGAEPREANRLGVLNRLYLGDLLLRRVRIWEDVEAA